MGFGRGKMEDSMTAGRKMVNPFLLKSSVVLFLSLAAFFTARHRPRRRAPSSPPPHSHSPSDAEPDLGASVGTLEEELSSCRTVHDYEEEEVLAKVTPCAPVTVEEDLFLNSSESSREEEEFPRFLLPDLNNLIQRETKTLTETLPSATLTNDFERKDVPAMEEEITNLKSLVQTLQERENYLEMQLLEFHGLKEQEVYIRELQNRLKISSMETNFLSLKIEALRVENEKLCAKVSDYSFVSAELEMQRKNFTILSSKMETICEEANEKVTSLHIRIAKLTERESKNIEDVARVEKQLKRLNELEDEVMKLQMENSRLVNENSELMKRLSPEHIFSPSVIRSSDFVQKNPELKPLEELNHLREENNKLKKEMEQLQTDRCAEIEELVYLRWVNACIRFELRNYHLPPGRTVARDLSRCLSLNSEQKVKELILEYSNSGFNLNQKGLPDFTLDDCSSQESSEECPETSLRCSKSKFNKPSKSKFLGKLKKLVLGKSSSAATPPSSDGNSDKRASASTFTIDEIAGRNSTDSSSCFSIENASENKSSGMIFYDEKREGSSDVGNSRRLNLEMVQKARSKSDLGEAYRRKSMVSVFDSFLEDREGGYPEKVKLKKFAQVFKNSQKPINLNCRPQ